MTIELLALAQTQPAPQGGGNAFLSFAPLIILFGIFWVMIIVPQRRHARAHEQMVASLQKGDQVITAGGLVGEIVGVKDDQVQLKTGASVVVVERSKIARRTGPLPAGQA